LLPASSAAKAGALKAQKAAAMVNAKMMNAR
jgi:hypothetical protein